MNFADVKQALQKRSKVLEGYPPRILFVTSKETFEKVIEAVEKQIPKKVYEKSDDYCVKHDVCPNCKRYVEDCYGYGWCNRCGQKLDFSDVADT